MGLENSKKLGWRDFDLSYLVCLIPVRERSETGSAFAFPFLDRRGGTGRVVLCAKASECQSMHSLSGKEMWYISAG